MIQLNFSEETKEAPSRWVAIASGSVLLSMAAGAAYLGLTINYSFAVNENIQADMVWVYVGADAIEFVLPFILAAVSIPRDKRVGLYAVLAACIFASCYCITSTSSELESKRLSHEEKAKKTYDDAVRRQREANATLARPDVTAEVEEVVDLQTQAAAAKEAADREGSRGKCWDKCEAAHADHRKILHRIGLAKARDAAKKELAEVQPVVSAGLPPPPGVAVIWGGTFGISTQTIANGHTAMRSVTPLIIIKFMVWFISPVAGWLLFKCGVTPRAKPAPAQLRAETGVQMGVTQEAAPAITGPSPEVGADARSGQNAHVPMLGAPTGAHGHDEPSKAGKRAKTGGRRKVGAKSAPSGQSLKSNDETNVVPFAKPTRDERASRCLELVAQGMNKSEIADVMGISRRTVSRILEEASEPTPEPEKQAL